MAQKSVYFPGLNGIRAIAASIVLVFHIDQFLIFFGLESLGFHKTKMAGYGVILFFCLSGYLITFLLFSEKAKFSRIDFKKFYIRRILRIWPLYYLIILLGLFLTVFLDNINYKEGSLPETVGLYSLLLANIGYFLGFGLTPITALWSVSVEEQFYAFWPLIISRFKKLIFPLLGIFISFLFIKVSLYLSGSGVYYLLKLTAFDSMAVGGIAAFLVFKNHGLLKILYHSFTQTIAWCFFLISILYKPVSLWEPIDYEMHSLFYTILILNVSTNNKSILKLENRFFDFLGRISYGIYVYHIAVICLLSYLFKGFIEQVNNPVTQYLLVFLSVPIVTITIAHFSFEYFESIFLKLKDNFSRIHSANKKPLTSTVLPIEESIEAKEVLKV